MKIVVLGSSVAGLHTALFLLSSNLNVDVEILEKAPETAHRIVCGGAIASYMVKRLKLQIPEEFVASEVRKVRFYSPSFDCAELRLQKAYGLVLWRDRWEKWLGERVEELGAKIRLNVRNPLETLKEADVVVGADGLTGVTRRLVGKPFPLSLNVHIAIQAVGKAKIADEEAISMYFGSQIAEKGYAWTFPLPGSQFRIGLGVPLALASWLKPCFKTFTESIGAKVTEKPKVKMIPTAPPEKTLVGNVMGKPIAFVGDAGLQADPATGGGIAPAILGAKCLAEALDQGSLKLYDRLWKGELYRRNRQRYELKQILCEMSDGEFEMLVDVLKDFEPAGESIGIALAHLLIELAFRHPKFLTAHKVLRRLIRKF